MAEEGGQLISASLTATPVFESGATADAVIADYKEQLRPIMEEGVDFIICEVMTNTDEWHLVMYGSYTVCFSVTVNYCTIHMESNLRPGVSGGGGGGGGY